MLASPQVIQIPFWDYHYPGNASLLAIRNEGGVGAAPAAYTQVITQREAAPPQPRARERVAAARETRREDNMSHQDPGANGVQPYC
jgi:hypothetical protein